MKNLCSKVTQTKQHTWPQGRASSFTKAVGENAGPDRMLFFP